MKMHDITISIPSEPAGEGPDFPHASISVALASCELDIADNASAYIMPLGDHAHALTFAVGATERAALMEIGIQWERMARAIIAAAERMPAYTTAELDAMTPMEIEDLHRKEAHPEWEYATVRSHTPHHWNGGRPPDGDGWERNNKIWNGAQHINWKRDANTHDDFWRRRKMVRS